MLPPWRVIRAISGRITLCAAIKSSTEVEDLSYSLPIQYGGDVNVRLTDSSGILRIRSRQSPVNSVAGAPAVNARTARAADFMDRTSVTGSEYAIRSSGSSQ